MSITPRELNRLLKEINLVILSFIGRSGSMLFQSLMDSHPQVASFPMTFVGVFEEIFGNGEIESFIGRHYWLFEKSEINYLHRTDLTVPALLGENRDQYVVVDKEGLLSAYKMLVEVLGRKPESPREMLILTHLALYHSRGFDISEVKYILYHLHSLLPHKYNGLLRKFPDARTVFMVRDHREGWAGWKQTIAFRNNGRFFLSDLENYILSTKREIERFQKFRAMTPSYKLVDLNELHLKGREVMEEVCDYLKIDFHHSMLESTFYGLKWWGNASDRKPISGLDMSRGIKKFPTVLSLLEIAMIEDAFTENMHEFNWRPLSSGMSQGRLTRGILKEYVKQFFKPYFYLPPAIHTKKLRRYFDEKYYGRLKKIPLLPNISLVHYSAICVFVCFKFFRSCMERWVHILKSLRVNRCYSPRYQPKT